MNEYMNDWMIGHHSDCTRKDSTIAIANQNDKWMITEFVVVYCNYDTNMVVMYFGNGNAAIAIHDHDHDHNNGNKVISLNKQWLQ